MTNQNHSERAHSVLGASSAYRWLACPGSVKLSEKFPQQKTSPAAAEGTAAHELAEACLLKKKNAKHFLGKKFNGFEATQEMVDGVQIYVDLVKTILKETQGSLSVEERFDLSWLHPGMFGTNDVCIREEFGTLYVIDLKYGMSVVEAENNSQLLYYALGAAHDGDYEEVELIIVQPRVDDPIKRWRTSMEEVIKFSKVLKKGALATKKKNAKLVSGDHCKYCNAQGGCPQVHKETMEITRTDFQKDKLPAADSLTPVQMSRILENKTKIKNFLDKVEELATAKLMKGEKLEGIKLVNKRARRTWDDEDEVVNIHGDDIYETKMMSVTQAEKKLGKQALEGMWNSVPTGVIAAHESDRRKEVKSHAKDDFDAIK